MSDGGVDETERDRPAAGARVTLGSVVRRLRGLFFGELRSLTPAGAFASALRLLRRKRWVVYAKPPFGSPEHVLAYLGRYTHRVAIANSRLSGEKAIWTGCEQGIVQRDRMSLSVSMSHTQYRSTLPSLPEAARSLPSGDTVNCCQAIPLLACRTPSRRLVGTSKT